MPGDDMKASRLSLVFAVILPAAAVAQDLKSDALSVPTSHKHGKLDVDIFTSEPSPPRSPTDIAKSPLHGWVPGDPRDVRGESIWVKHLSHVGYAGLGVAGVVVSLASGGVAPAVGFGVVALYQSWQEWRQITLDKPD